jgi:hypothetical protein
VIRKRKKEKEEKKEGEGEGRGRGRGEERETIPQHSAPVGTNIGFDGNFGSPESTIGLGPGDGHRRGREGPVVFAAEEG